MNSRRDVARRRAIAVMRLIAENIAADPEVNLTEAARAADVAPSTFYRWLNKPPEKIDVTGVAGVADFLHDQYGHDDFAALWRRVSASVK